MFCSFAIRIIYKAPISEEKFLAWKIYSIITDHYTPNPSRLSFSRSMLRRMIKENWCVNRVRFQLDKEGYGYAIYEIKTPKQLYSLICFSQYIDESERSDRVIAEKWDTSYALLIGKISEKDFERLKTNIPLQEAGRNSSKELVISRANKSVRLFDKVVYS